MHNHYAAIIDSSVSTRSLQVSCYQAPDGAECEGRWREVVNSTWRDATALKIQGYHCHEPCDCRIRDDVPASPTAPICTGNAENTTCRVCTPCDRVEVSGSALPLCSAAFS